MLFRGSRRARILAARCTRWAGQISGITLRDGLPLYITYTGTDVLGPGRRHNQPSEPGLNVILSEESWTHGSAPVLCRSGCSVEWRPESGLWQRGKGLGRRAGNLQLEPLPVQVHSAQSKGPRIELRFESFNTFNHTNPQDIDTDNHDGNFGEVTSDYGPRTLEFGGKFVF